MINKKIKAVYIIKPDLDTVVAGYLFLQDQMDYQIKVLTENANNEILANPENLCLECGGDGDTTNLNFDHHLNSKLPCATEQVWKSLKYSDKYKSLVTYVTNIDKGIHSNKPYDNKNISLSFLFSGMRLLNPDNKKCFTNGITLLKVVFDNNDNNLASPEALVLNKDMPKDILDFIDKKIQARKELEAQSSLIKNTYIKGLKISYLCTALPGVHGLLHRHGADISIAQNPNTKQISISSNEKDKFNLQMFTKDINNRDLGWGGHVDLGIIGSPRKGSDLNLAIILKLIAKNAI